MLDIDLSFNLVSVNARISGLVEKEYNRSCRRVKVLDRLLTLQCRNVNDFLLAFSRTLFILSIE